jgi:hypothetical protein
MALAGITDDTRIAASTGITPITAIMAITDMLNNLW